MESFTIESFTAIVSMVTAITAILAPMITAIITERGQTKRKTLELLFTEKLAAYKDFMECSSKFFSNPLNSDSLNALRTTMDRACLLASPKTYRTITSFISLLFEIEPPSYTFDQMEKIAHAHASVIQSLRAELSEYNVYKSWLRRLKDWIIERIHTKNQKNQ